MTHGTIGFYIAQALALEAGMAVLLCGRDVEKVRDAARKIAEQAAAEGKLKPIMYQVISLIHPVLLVQAVTAALDAACSQQQ